ncbi:MAG: caspase family protein [Verrucomicrobiales bacterium]|nr:caspase family protein [Verrucomicrobiales bacterium]
MNRILLLPVLALMAFIGSAPAAERVALVIGNDAYQHARPLKAAVNDAAAVAATLQTLGFDTLSSSNAGLEQMVEAMETLKVKAAGAQAVLVYYAGHGVESQGANYLVPVDAKLEKEIQLQTQAVNLNSVLEKLTALNVPARMVILDCCRDNPLEGRTWLATRAVGTGGLGELAVQSLPAATLVVYSASPGKPALDRVSPTDRHSPFTQALLDTLPEPGVHSFEVFGRVEEAVLTRTDGRQSPRVFYNGSTLPFRNFTFATASSGGAAATIAEAPPATPSAPVSTAPVMQTPPAAPPPVVSEPDAPPSTAPAMPELPQSGYFDLDQLFATGPYAAYNSYSRGQILKQAQTKLKAAGLYASSADGVPGPGTQRAILAHQQAQSLPLSGKLDTATIGSLGLDGIQQMTAPKPQNQTPSGKPAPSRLTPEQRVLRALTRGPQT